MKEKEYKVGDLAPYKNTRSNIKLAKINSFETVENGKVWFRGIDTITNAKVWYPVHISKTLKANQSLKPCKHLFYSVQNKPHCMVELKEKKISVAIDTQKCNNCTKYKP